MYNYRSVGPGGKSMDENLDGLNVYRVSCKWEVGVRLG